MADGLYTALSGGIASLQVLDVQANNLANADSHGYKLDRIVFSEVLKAVSPDAPADTAQVVSRATVVDSSQGSLTQTRNPLDLAFNGKGFFTVQTPAGTRYTRRGDFKLAEDGALQTAEGHPVLGRDGPVKLPKGEVTIDEKGGISVGRNKVADLRLADFPDAALRKEGGALFTAAGAETPATGQIVQGNLERSNVSAMAGMSGMLTASRTFELVVQMMQSYRRMDEKLVADMGKGS